jgi:hypothetical protein
MGGIKELVADVDVVAADIQSGAITAEKMASDQARWGKLTIQGVGTTSCGTWTCTSAVTVLRVIGNVTTAASADGTVTVQDTAKSTIVCPARSSTAATTLRTECATALENTPPVCPLAAGKSLEVTNSVNTDKLAGTLYIEYIPT